MVCPSCGFHLTSAQAVCPGCQGDLLSIYQCQERSCGVLQEAMPHCLSCARPLTGPLSGKTIAWEDRRYHIRERLGGGGMGEVYRAYPEGLRDHEIQEVALKFNNAVGDEERFSRFRREVAHLSMVHSPHCVEVYGYGEYQEEGIRQAQFMVMECLRGQTLSELLANGPLSVEQAKEIFRQLSEALFELHKQGVIHRDLKPDNIMLQQKADGIGVKLYDFGLAKDAFSASELSSSGVIMGTLWYMSPEQARGEKIDARSDLFSLGVLLYQMLTGILPYPAANLFQLYQLHINGPPPIQKPLLLPLPALLEGTLAYRVEDRFADASEALSVLEGEEGTQETGRFSPSVEGAAPQSQKRLAAHPPGLPSSLLLLLLAIALGSGGLAVFFFLRAKPPAPAVRGPGIGASQAKTPQRRPSRPRLRSKLRAATTRPTGSRPAPRQKQPRPRTPRSPLRKKAAPARIQVHLHTDPPCQQLTWLTQPPQVLGQSPFSLPEGRHAFKCYSPNIRLHRRFELEVKKGRKRVEFRQIWKAVKVKLFIRPWAFPSVDGFFLARCQDGCVVTLWSGRSEIVLKRPIQGTQKRALVYKRQLPVPESLQSQPLARRIITVRWKNQKP